MALKEDYFLSFGVKATIHFNYVKTEFDLNDKKSVQYVTYTFTDNSTDALNPNTFTYYISKNIRYIFHDYNDQHSSSQIGL